MPLIWFHGQDLTRFDPTNPLIIAVIALIFGFFVFAMLYSFLYADERYADEESMARTLYEVLS